MNFLALTDKQLLAMIKMMMVVAVVVLAVITAAMGGEVYQVGDDAGWTSIGHVDYKTWASTKLFRVGDTIVFSYNQIFHDVARVSYTDYLSCNGSRPYTTFTSGNDSFPIKYPGHYFFICTQPNHCKSGQKVDIRVPLSGVHSAPPPFTVVSPAPMQPLPFPYPQPFVPSPSPATSPPAPVQAPTLSQSPAPSVSEQSASPTPVVPAPEIAPAQQQKSTASQLGFGFKIWSTMMAVFFYLFGFGF